MQSKSNATILMIEDNPADAALITEQLHRSGNDDLTVHNVPSLAAGLNRATADDVGAILLDLSLPDSHGMATFTRTYQHVPDIPIVVLTGNDDERLGIEAVQQGAQDYLVKGKVDGVTLGRTLRFAVLRKRVDAELRRAQRLKVTNELAGALAHDFNNLLMVVLGQLQSLEWPLRNNEALHGRVRDTIDTILNGAALTQRLLTLAQQSTAGIERTALADAVSGLLPALKRQLGHSTPLAANIDDGAGYVDVDPEALESIVLTLVVSARDAMLGSGRITLEVGAGPPLPGETEPSALLSISDIGPPAASGEEAEAFSPDFSNRKDGSGKGLALAMCLSFAEQFGGQVSVTPQAHGGKTVTLRLPQCEAPRADGVGSNSSLGADCRVLLLEENDLVRDVTREFLSRLGARVTAVENAAAALAHAESGERFDAFVFEPTLSAGVPAQRLLGEILKLRPNLRILMTPAGFGQTPAPPADVACVTLPKPYRQADLEFALKSLLRDAGDAGSDHH